VMTVDKPIIGPSARAPDGVENVAVFRLRGPSSYVMIYSEGLENQARAARARARVTLRRARRAADVVHVRRDAQHLARMDSTDLFTWTDRGPLQLLSAKRNSRGSLLPPEALINRPKWMAARYGAPFVWREPTDGCFYMALMGEYDIKTHRSALGLLFSADGERWALSDVERPPQTKGGRVTALHTKNREEKLEPAERAMGKTTPEKKDKEQVKAEAEEAQDKMVMEEYDRYSQFEAQDAMVVEEHGRYKTRQDKTSLGQEIFFLDKTT